MLNSHKKLLNSFWNYFKFIASIPHVSDHEEQLSNALKQELLKFTTDVIQDKNNCLITHINATKGYEKMPMLTFQAHIDMVGAKTAKSKHNFLKDPIKIIEKDGWIHANETSLGADDGIGVATALAIVSTKEINHGPIEIIFTTKEETTTQGANELNPKYIRGKYLLNIDSEFDNYITIGSSGLYELWTKTSLELQTPSKNNYVQMKLNLHGAYGGHSGIDIHLPRINVINVINEVLFNIIQKNHIHLAKMNMGNATNAICTEGECIISVYKNEYELIKKTINDYLNEIKLEYNDAEPKFNWSITKQSNLVKHVSFNQTKKILNALVNIRSGIFMRDEENGINISSNNIGIINLVKDKLIVKILARSLYPHRYKMTIQTAKALLNTMGKTIVEYEEILPSWVNESSKKPLADAFSKSFKKIYGYIPKLLPSSGFLETNILMQKCKNFKEAITYGCIIESVHSPKERMNIKSLEKFIQVIGDFVSNKNLK